MEWLNNLLHNTYFVFCAMAIIIFGATQLIKLPIKHFTDKITNERVRRVVNTTILLIPFALGIVLEFLYSTYYLHEMFNIITGFGYGAAAVSLYGLIERFFKVKDPYKTKSGQTVTDFIYDLVKDGKIDESDTKTVQDFLDSVIHEDNGEKENAANASADANAPATTAVKEFLDKVNK